VAVDYFSLSLLGAQDPILLVGANDAIRLCRSGEFEELSEWEAISSIEGAAVRNMFTFRCLLSRLRLTSTSLRDLDDHQVLMLVTRSLRTNELVAVRRQSGGARKRESGQATSTPAQRRLVAAIETATRGRIVHAGRRYKLIADLDLAKLPGRDDFEVVPHDAAVEVLNAVAADSGSNQRPAELFVQARDQLTRDWRPPLTPDGLILLRKARRMAVVQILEPALTPSQLAQLEPDTVMDTEVELEEVEMAVLVELEHSPRMMTSAESDDSSESDFASTSGTGDEAPAEGESRNSDDGDDGMGDDESKGAADDSDRGGEGDAAAADDSTDGPVADTETADAEAAAAAADDEAMADQAGEDDEEEAADDDDLDDPDDLEDDEPEDNLEGQTDEAGGDDSDANQGEAPD